MVFIRRNESNRRKHVAAARAGLIALFSLISLPKIGFCQTIIPQQGQGEKPQTKPQTPFPVAAITQDRAQYKPHCESPPTREDAEYCQEWSATIAAEEQAKWAYYQFFASITGIGSVIVTLVYTMKSVKVSQRGAKAAEDAVVAMKDIDKRQGEDIKVSIAESARAASAMADIAEAMKKQATLAHQSYLATHRPRLKVRFVVSGVLEEGREITAGITVTNVGYTNCRVAGMEGNIFVRFEPTEVNQVAWSVVPQNVPLNPVIEPSKNLYLTVFGDTTLQRDQIVAVQKGSFDICLAGMMIYDDDNGTRRTTSFFRVYDPGTRRYRRPTEADAYSEYDYED